MKKIRLKHGILGQYSGKVGTIIIQENGVIRVQRISPKRRKPKKG